MKINTKPYRYYISIVVISGWLVLTGCDTKSDTQLVIGAVDNGKTGTLETSIVTTAPEVVKN